MAKKLLTLIKRVKYELTYFFKPNIKIDGYQNLNNFTIQSSMPEDIKKIFWRNSDNSVFTELPFIVFGKDLSANIKDSLSSYDDFFRSMSKIPP